MNNINMLCFDRFDVSEGIVGIYKTKVLSFNLMNATEVMIY